MNDALRVLAPLVDEVKSLKAALLAQAQSSTTQVCVSIVIAGVIVALVGCPLAGLVAGAVARRGR